MIRFGSGPITMMLGLILATGSAVPIIARCGGTGVLAKGSGGTHSVGETKVSPAVAKARDLESELERLRTERILRDAERALALTEKATMPAVNGSFWKRCLRGGSRYNAVMGLWIW